MDINEECLQRACEAFDAATGQPRNAVAAAIEAYLAEMFKPGQVQMLEPLEAIPQRDYRKELWIAVATATAAHAAQGFQPASWADETLKAFDTAFPQEPTNG